MKEQHPDPRYNDGENYENNKAILIMSLAALCTFGVIALIAGSIMFVLQVFGR